jgi:DNA-binding winged helix-turn-helix (wHTH) protein
MMRMSSRRSLLRFGEFTFDPKTLELRRSGVPVALQPKPTLVLARLLEAPGELVTREEIYAAAWPETAVSVDLALNTCIRQIREVLGDRAVDATFLQTVPRRGYRFVAKVTEGAAAVRRLPRNLSALAAAAVTGFLAGLGASHVSADPSIDIRPVVELDSATVPGLAGVVEEELRTHMAHALRGRATVLASEDAQREATYRIEGSIHATIGSSPRLSLSVVRVRDGVIVWAGVFNPTCPDVADPMGVIARLVTKAVPAS